MRQGVTKVRSNGLLFLGFAMSIFLVFAGSAGAAEVAADFETYCRNAYGPAAFVNVDRRDNGRMCSIRAEGGLGLRHYRVDAATVCAEQHATRRYRRDGRGVVCLTGPAEADGSALRVIDLEKHCKAAYGPYAYMTTRTADGRPMCTLRTDGGLGLRHDLIDLDALCGGTAPRVEGKMLHCGGLAGPSGKTPNESSDRRSARNTSGRKGQGPKARMDGQSEAADAAARPATGNLEGCAIFGGGIPDFGKLIGSDRKSVEQGGVAFPCSGLSGGWEADLHDICGDGTSGAGFKGKLDWQGDRPVCRVQPVPQLPERILTPPLWAACAVRYRNLTGQNLFPPRGSTKTAQPSDGTGTVLAYRWDERNLHCFLVPQKAVDCYEVFLTDGSYPPECLETEVAIQPVDVRFVRAERPYETIDRLNIGISFRVEVLFEHDPGRRSEPVTVRNEQTGETLELTAEQTADPKVFRTSPVDLLPEVRP